MTKAEFSAIMPDLQHELYDCGALYPIGIGYESYAEFAIGCFYDESDRKWKMFVNGERGMHSIWLESESEEVVFDELYSYILYLMKPYKRG